MDLIVQIDAPRLRKIDTDRPDKFSGINWIFKSPFQLDYIGIFSCKLEISSFKRIEQRWLNDQLGRKFPRVRIQKKW